VLLVAAICPKNKNQEEIAMKIRTLFGKASGFVVTISMLSIFTSSLSVHAASGDASQVQPLCGTETRVTNAAADQFDPAIAGNLVVYTDFSGVDADVWYTDLATGLPHPVTTAPGDQQLTGVSDNKILFTDWNTMDVLVFDVATGVATNITNAAGSNSLDPAISGSLAAWTDDRDGNAEIYARDLQTGVERRITNDPLVDESPAVSGSLIVWERCDGYACDIFVYDWATGATRQLTATPYASERFPDVFGRTVVFQREQGTPIDKDLVAVNLDAPSEKVLALAGDQENAHISGDFVSFNDSASGVPHIGLWQLSTGRRFEVTAGTGGQYLNDIDGNRIVYTDNRADTLDIYMYTFNLPPVAEAGEDQTSVHDRLVTLDGSASSDPDQNYPLTYSWVLAATPPGSTATLQNGQTIAPTFTPDLAGDYRLSLVVTDSLGCASPPDTVLVSTTNSAPVADAGPDKTVSTLGATVQLSGGSSYDPEGDAINYAWTLTRKPVDSSTSLADPLTATPSFIADVHGDYVASLVVTDTFGAVSQTDTVTISFDNVKPVANAGGNQSVTVGSTVTLDGSASFDGNLDRLFYSWSIVSKPAGSTAQLSTPDTKITGIRADLAGDYVISLIVNDGFVSSEPNNATIHATLATQSAVDTLIEASTTINALPASAFKNGNMASTLTNKINAVLQLIEQGKYADARDKLQNDILAKTDGCATTGSSDKNDWIMDCVSQGKICVLILEAIQRLAWM
jgi:beta propeller repeat protein